MPDPTQPPVTNPNITNTVQVTVSTPEEPQP
jgi:hypothetical protein